MMSISFVMTHASRADHKAEIVGCISDPHATRHQKDSLNNVEGLGVNRFSLFAEFGNKQALFDAALERYNRDVIERRFGPLEAPTAGIEEVRALLAFYGSAGRGPASGRGCLS